MKSDRELPEFPYRAPDLIFEIVSPGWAAMKRDYEEKREEYERLGAREYVIVDRGDVPMNDHTLAYFRVDHGAVLDRLLTEQVAELMSVGAVTLERVAQDGMRVRASAGASSFRRKPTLEECLVEAQEQVTTLNSRHGSF